MALYTEGENCSRAILRAASEKYKFPLSQELLDSCNAMSAGFCIGGMCSAIIAGVMVFGVLFPADEAKQKSLILFCNVQDRWNCMDCCKLSAKRDNCNDLIWEISAIIEEIIDD